MFRFLNTHRICILKNAGKQTRDLARPGVVVWLLALGLVTGLLMASPQAFAENEGQQTSPPFDIAQVPTPGAPPAAVGGRSIFAENCAPCHGPEGRGDGPTASSLPNPPAVFADPEVVWERSPAELFFTAKFGRMDKMMPPWESRLNDKQIWDAVSFAWSLHTSEDAVTQGADLYSQACASCHGPEGRGDGPDAEGTLPDFTDQAYMMAQSQADLLAGWEQAHPEIGQEWSQDEKRNVLEAVRAFSYIPPWESPYRPGDGVITGKVVQGTDGSENVAGVEVTLDAFLEFTPVATFTTTVDAEGAFQFSGLSTDPNVVYFASAPWKGISYSSPVLSFPEGETSIDTAVAVYEPTDDPSGVVINRMHWIIDDQPGALVVGEILAFGNTQDRAFVGRQVEGVDEPVTVAIRVPDGAQ
ncbi:MAG: hypothetical protein D6790_04535, partial [Caldilineae bacterium]